MGQVAADGVKGEPWTRHEIDVAVAGYLDMLRAEVRGERYFKVEAVRRLQAMLPARSSTSIERKLQNISAVRDESGLVWIDGYKPLSHYQHGLREAVLSANGADHRIGEVLATYEATSLVAPQARRLATDDVLVAAPSAGERRGKRSSVALSGGQIPALRDFQTRQLGAAGEEWVIDLEREGLKRAGRPDLAGRVSWVSREVGDGAGYDIGSFRLNGEERLIEVKTTNLGPKTPFYITRWEIEVSRENRGSYSLYRVHGFARDPRIYVLDGSIEELARLEPKIFLGLPL